jgi:ferritin-like metal-binding protein YciE
METTTEKFIHEVQDAYDAEHRFMRAMETMSKKAADSSLKRMIDEHIGQSEEHISALEQVFSELGEKPKRQKCDGASGIVAEGDAMLKEAAKAPELLDSVIGAALSKAEHYELASYKGLLNGAQEMGSPAVVEAIDRIFQEEQRMVSRLEESAPKLLQRAKAAEGSR